MIYLTLFLEFFKVGLFSVGGGLSTIPFLYELADKYTWFDEKMLMDMIAVSQSTPGAIGVNMATFAGFRASGILGGIIATLGLVTPSVIVIIIIAHFLNKFKESRSVESIFYGLRPAVAALIAAAGYQVFKVSILALDKFKVTHKLLDLINIKSTILLIILIFAISKLPSSFNAISSYSTPYDIRDKSFLVIPITSHNVSYGLPLIASNLSFDISKAWRTVAIVCVPFTNWTLTKLSSVWKILAYIFSITSRPTSLYPYPVVLFICIVETLLSLKAFNTFAWLYRAISFISLNTSLTLSSIIFAFSKILLFIPNILDIFSNSITCPIISQTNFNVNIHNIISLNFHYISNI